MESIHFSRFKSSLIPKVINPMKGMTGKNNGRTLGLTVSNTDPNIYESISKISKLYNAIDSMKHITLKTNENVKQQTLSPKGKKTISIIDMLTLNCNSTNNPSKPMLFKSNSCTNNKLPLLKSPEKQLNSESPHSLTSHTTKATIQTYNNKLIEKIKKNYLGSKGANLDLQRMSNAIKYMLDANKKRTNILRTLNKRKVHIKTNSNNKYTINKVNSLTVNADIELTNPRHSQRNPKPKIANDVINSDNEIDDSFDMPEDEAKRAEILLDSPSATSTAIKYPRIITSPPTLLNDDSIMPTEQPFITNQYKNANTFHDRIIRKLKFKHKILQTEPLGIIKEEDEQSDLTKTHSSLNKNKSILINTKSNGYSKDKQIKQQNGNS